MNTSRQTCEASGFPESASQISPSPSRPHSGFTIIEVIGVLAVMATLMAILVPNIIDQLDRAVQEAEARNVKAIGQGVELYLTQNLNWPNGSIITLAPEYVPFDRDQTLLNPRGFLRYLRIHPDANPYNNGNGIAPSNLSDFRFMVISDLTQNANPITNNAAQFDNWWDTDDSIVPDLVIYRGTIKPLLSLVSLSAVRSGGAPGSFRIDGRATNSFGNSPSSIYGQYHLKGTLVELSETPNFGGGGGVTISFNLTADAGYQWDSNCAAGVKWHALGGAC